MGNTTTKGPDPSAPTTNAAGTQVKKEALPKLLNLLFPIVYIWDLFALQIGVPPPQISQIKAATPQTGPNYLNRCFTQALEWWQSNHDNPVYEIMIDVLDPGIGKVTTTMNRALANEVREFMAKERAAMIPMAATGTHAASRLKAPTKVRDNDDFTQINEFKIQGKFASLLEFAQMKLQQKLGAKKIKRDLRLFVIRLFRQKIPESLIPISSDVAVIFEAMRSHDLLNYWNFYPLEEVINHFCSDDSEIKSKMEQYKKDRSGYQLATKIKDYISKAKSKFPYGCVEFAPALQPKRTPAYLTELAMKLDDRVAEYHLNYLEDLWLSLSDVLYLPPLHLLLDAVIMDSVLVVWLIPTGMVPEATERAKQNADFFRKYPILKVTIGDECVYSKTEPTELGGKQSKCNCCLIIQEVIGKGKYAGLCESCANQKQVEERKLVKMESQQQSNEHAMKAALECLDNDSQNKETIAERSKDLEHSRNEYSAEMEKENAQLKLRLMERKEKESLRQSHEAHRLDLQLKEQQQLFDHEMEMKRVNAQIEMDREFAGRMVGQIKATASSGDQLQIQFAADSDPAFLKSLFQEFEVVSHPTHQSLPALQDEQSTEPDDQTTED